MLRYSLVMLVASSVAGCAAEERVSKLPALHGQSRAQVISKLSSPQRDEKFPMSKAYGEFRIELQNTYPLTNPVNADVEIEEMTWRDGDYWITLWLHQVNGVWTVLDSCRWRKDIRF